MKYLSIVLLFIIHFECQGQCNNFNNSQCELPLDWKYEYNSQSFDAEFIQGQMIRVKVIFNEGYDYYFGFCTNDEAGVPDIQLITQDNETIADESDLKAYNNINYLEISAATTTVVLIVIKTKKTSAVNIDINDKKCLGVIVGNKITED
jgi:hypothetical protein